MFSVGLILLIAFSVFSPLQILKIGNVNAQVTVPKTYVQTVNDPGIDSSYAWENFTTGLDPDSYAHVPGIPSYWYDWVNINIGTSYGGGYTNWTIQNHSNNNDSVLICLEGGMFGYCHPAIETFAPFSEYLTVITNIYDVYYGLYWGNGWIKPLADGLRSMGFTYVHFLGFSSGAMCVASYVCHHDAGGVFDSAIAISGYLNQIYMDGDLDRLANYSNNVTVPTCIVTPTSDIPMYYGNGTLQAEQFYGNLSGGLTKELHYFNGGHNVFWYYEVGTGKTVYEVVGEWIIPYYYDWVNVTLGTPYNGWDSYYGYGSDRNWTMQNHSPNNDSVIVCLGGGDIGFIYPARDTFEPLSNTLTVCTNSFMAAYIDIDDKTWIIPLANALKAMGFSHLYFLGYSSGACCVASWLCHNDNGTTFDSAIVISGMLDDHGNPTIPSIEELANYSGNVTTKTEILHGIDDAVCPYYQALGFYSNLTVSGKEMHTFNDGHNVFSNTEISTGKSAYQVVAEFLNFPVSNDEYGTFTAYAKRVGADEWGDCIARQGYYPHLNSYCLDWNNKIIKPMIHYPYIPADIGNDQIILQATGKHSAPVWYGNWPPFDKSLWGPTIGATIMLYFNVYVHDNIHGGDKWLFNFHESNPWAGPNMFVLEIFMTRWVVPMNYPGVPFQSVSPGYWAFEAFFSRSTHDNDLHLITCPFAMPQNDQWYYFLYDVGNKLRDGAEKIQIWSMGSNYIPAYTVLGFQLMTIAMGVETIGGSWTFQFGDISLTDMRWGTGSAYQNSAQYQLKTRFNENYSIPPPIGAPPGHPNFPVPRLGGSIGDPNPLRPYMTYTNDTLDSDINNDNYVGSYDLLCLLSKFGSREKHPYDYPMWDYSRDIIPDGYVGSVDLTRLLAVFGSHPTNGTYQTGLGTIVIFMQEIDISGGLGLYWPDPPPGYTGPPWMTMRTTPYTCHLYLEMWDVIDWPNYVCRTINLNPCINYMGYCDVFNGTTLSQVGACFYAFNYAIHD
jgi:predicted esterase